MPPDLEPKPGSAGSWDPSKLFHVSEQEMNLMRRRKEMRTMLRDEFKKRYTNPYTRGQGGHIFDPALQRFNAIRATEFNHFKPNKKAGRMALLGCVLPICIMFFGIHYDRKTFRDKLDSGEKHNGNRAFYEFGCY